MAIGIIILNADMPVALITMSSLFCVRFEKAPIPANKKIKGTLKSIAKAGKVASLATLAVGQPEIAAPLGAVAEAIDQVGSGDTNNFGTTMKKLASIPKKRKKVPRYTLAAAKKNFEI